MAPLPAQLAQRQAGLIVLRVAMVSPYSLSVPGGVQGQVLGLAEALRRRGHQTVVVGPLDAHQPGEPSGPAGTDTVIGVGRSFAVPANGSVARLSLGPISAARTWRAMARWQPDVLHLHEPLAPGPTWTCLARPEAKVGTFHRAGAVRGRLALGPPARMAASRLDQRAAVSEEARLTAQRLAGGEYDVIGNGVDVLRFSGAEPAPTKGPTILFVGRHEERKGLAVLCEAFARVGPGLGARLWVVGEGPLTPQLRRTFDRVEGIEWLGPLDDRALASRLAGAQVLCAPSLYGESFGVVLLEALAARCAVIASDLPGYRSVLGDHGALVPPGDTGALAAALDSVLTDVRNASGRALPASLDDGAAHCLQWSMDAVAERYEALYAKAIRRHRDRDRRS